MYRRKTPNWVGMQPLSEWLERELGQSYLMGVILGIGSIVLLGSL